MAVKARTVVLSGQQQSFDDIARHRTLLHQSVRGSAQARRNFACASKVRARMKSPRP